MRRFFITDKMSTLEDVLWRHTLRVNDGTGVLLKNGLVVTNHHVVASAIAAVLGDATAGFAASELRNEIPLNVQVLRLTGPPVSQPVLSSEYSYIATPDSGLYYPYKHYQARLVFSPDSSVLLSRKSASDGLVNYALDIAILRIYERDRPIVANGIEISFEPLDRHQAVFAAGHPEFTDRRLTHAEMQYQRDVVMPLRLRLAQSKGTPNQVRIAQACIRFLDKEGLSQAEQSEKAILSRAENFTNVKKVLEESLAEIGSMVELKRCYNQFGIVRDKWMLQEDIRILKPDPWFKYCHFKSIDTTRREIDGQINSYQTHFTRYFENHYMQLSEHKTSNWFNHDILTKFEEIENRIAKARRRIEKARRKIGDDWEDAEGDVRFLCGIARGVMTPRHLPHAIPGRTSADIYLLDIDVTSGCSGSPVVDEQGKLIGVIYGGNKASLSSIYGRHPDGRALAISSLALRAIAEDKGVKIT